MNSIRCVNVNFFRNFLRSILGVSISVLLIASVVAQARAQAPSFTFTAAVPSQVNAGQTFVVPASITDIGGQATDYHSYFQVYDLGFNFKGQTYYDNQSFDPGQTLNYNVPITAPTTPGTYYLAGLMFNQNYSSGIVSQQFFSPTFDVVPAPEPSYGVLVGLLIVGLLGVNARRLRFLRTP